MNREDRIRDILENELSPQALEIKNNSHLHKGHLGDDGTLETHYLVKIKSKKLDNLSRIESHKIINNLLKDEFKKGLHALEIKIIKI